MDEIAVLVLNYTFEPLHFTNRPPAPITLLLAGKAEAVEGRRRVVRSPSVTFAATRGDPARDGTSASRSSTRVAFNKKNILRRERHTCQYCNRRGERAHGRPRGPARAGARRGGGWVNVVAACLRCNLLKGNRLPTRSGHATHPGAGASQVSVSRRHNAPASARDSLLGLVAEKYLLAVPTPS